MEDEPELIRLMTEEALQEHFHQGAVHIVFGQILVPRIAEARGWFPPSMRACQRIRELETAGEEVTFEKVEGGRDIRRAWEKAVEREDFAP
jgi:hypothetical protein